MYLDNALPSINHNSEQHCFCPHNTWWLLIGYHNLKKKKRHAIFTLCNAQGCRHVTKIRLTLTSPCPFLYYANACNIGHILFKGGNIIHCEPPSPFLHVLSFSCVVSYSSKRNAFFALTTCVQRLQKIQCEKGLPFGLGRDCVGLHMCPNWSTFALNLSTCAYKLSLTKVDKFAI
jgi:hypothetical protein